MEPALDFAALEDESDAKVRPAFESAPLLGLLPLLFAEDFPIDLFLSFGGSRSRHSLARSGGDPQEGSKVEESRKDTSAPICHERTFLLRTGSGLFFRAHILVGRPVTWPFNALLTVDKVFAPPVDFLASPGVLWLMAGVFGRGVPVDNYKNVICNFSRN